MNGQRFIYKQQVKICVRDKWRTNEGANAWNFYDMKNLVSFPVSRASQLFVLICNRNWKFVFFELRKSLFVRISPKLILTQLVTFKFFIYVIIDHRERENCSRIKIKGSWLCVCDGIWWTLILFLSRVCGPVRHSTVCYICMLTVIAELN